MNFILQIINYFMYKRKLSRHKIGYFSTINRNRLEYSRFLSFYNILDANLGPHLHGDVSAMHLCRFV